MAFLIGGAYLGLGTTMINGTIALGVDIASKRGKGSFSSQAGVPISAGIIGLSGAITFATNESVSKNPIIQKVYKYAVPFLLTVSLTPIISTYFKYPKITMQESLLYGFGGMLSIRTFS
ncbi:MAG: hypothetical protein KFB93_06475 [Simkaniaceae bacterium]|nr:MAG: hypothetical protein KFB93_06475 [Simkaniaceae bacterium]